MEIEKHLQCNELWPSPKPSNSTVLNNPPRKTSSELYGNPKELQEAFLTKPLIFDGSQLELNFSTSAAGSLRVELQYENGQPIPGFSLEDCHEYFGDSTERVVKWNRDPDLSEIAGRTVRIRFELKDADLY